jgi:hypothetical protein
MWWAAAQAKTTMMTDSHLPWIRVADGDNTERQVLVATSK